MRRAVLGGAIAFLALGKPTGAQVAPPPRVEVVTRLFGEIFLDIPERQQARLQHDIAEAFTAAAAPRFPSVEWKAVGWRNALATALSQPAAVIYVDLIEQRHGFADRLYLSFAATMPGTPAPKRLSSCGAWLVQRLLARFIGDLDQLRQTVADSLATHLAMDDFERGLNLDFIRYVPLADRIAVDTPHQRIIVPVDAQRLRLEDGSRLLVELAAPFCRGNPERCTLVLASRGPIYGDEFRGQLQTELLERRECCTTQTWTPELASQVELAVHGSVHVYLDADHRHCPFVSPCAGSRGRYRQPGVQ